MRPPYPVELVPLFPEFLNKRRTKFTFPLRLLEELGIDRPALFFAIGGVAPQGGGRFGEMWNPYATQWDQHQAASAVARDAGLVDEQDGRWDLTPKGRALMKRVRHEADAYLATLVSPVSVEDLARLASVLGRAFEATAASLDRRWHSHIPRAARMAGDATAHPMVALENAVYGLWQARDDCHMAAWRQAGFDGPTLDALTRIWRGEAAGEEDLAAKLSSQRPADVAAGLARLRRDGLVTEGPPRTTEKGTKARQAIEDETDRLYFSGWPDDVASSAGWVRENLAAVNASF